MDPVSTTTTKRHPLTKRIAYNDTPPSGSVVSVGAEGGSKEPAAPQTDSNIGMSFPSHLLVHCSRLVVLCISLVYHFYLDV